MFGLTLLLLTGSFGGVITHAADINKYADGNYVKTHWLYEDVIYAIDNG